MSVGYIKRMMQDKVDQFICQQVPFFSVHLIVEEELFSSTKNMSQIF